jgi:ATP-binding cassette subfamily B protein
MTHFTKALKKFEVIFSKMERNQSKYSNINTVLSSIIEWLVYIFVGARAICGLIGLGDLFKYINSINQFGQGLTGFLNTFNALRTNNAYLEVLYDYLDIPNNKYQGTLSVEKRDDNDYAIEFKNVSFKYPGSDAYALKNLNLKLTVGQRMAVVGMNGSGKTTMIKLLCRLYDPTEGEILLNGFDIKKYDYGEYMDLFSVVFQDFRLFSFPLGQNVASVVNYDNKKAEHCLNMAGFGGRLNEMQKGLETPLYKDFEEDGVEISGGEAQKIALARALYKDAPFVVLDEPTAALDPIAEFEIYSKFDDIVGEKTAIYISHRLSSCRFCDDIAVFHESKLIQRGSHDALIADANGKYHELWNAQAQYYSAEGQK